MISFVNSALAVCCATAAVWLGSAARGGSKKRTITVRRSISAVADFGPAPLSGAARAVKRLPTGCTMRLMNSVILSALIPPWRSCRDTALHAPSSTSSSSFKFNTPPPAAPACCSSCAAIMPSYSSNTGSPRDICLLQLSQRCLIATAADEAH